MLATTVGSYVSNVLDWLLNAASLPVYVGVSELPGLIILNANPDPLPIVDPTNTLASSITEAELVVPVLYNTFAAKVDVNACVAEL